MALLSGVEFAAGNLTTLLSTAGLSSVEEAHHLLEVLHGGVIGSSGLLLTSWGLKSWGLGQDSGSRLLGSSRLLVSWGEFGELLDDSSDVGTTLSGGLAGSLGSSDNLGSGRAGWSSLELLKGIGSLLLLEDVLEINSGCLSLLEGVVAEGVSGSEGNDSLVDVTLGAEL